MASLDRCCRHLGVLLYALISGGCASSIEQQIDLLQSPPPVQTVQVEQMSVNWRVVNDVIEFETSAPTLGWVALGFNATDDIENANLIMGAVVDGVARVEDRYVVAVGDHRQVEAIGGTNALMHASGEEQNGSTTIRFALPIKAVDDYHMHLQSGTEIYLIAAYSVDDDFAHHSRMRQHLRITL